MTYKEWDNSAAKFGPTLTITIGKATTQAGALRNGIRVPEPVQSEEQKMRNAFGWSNAASRAYPTAPREGAGGNPGDQ